MQHHPLTPMLDANLVRVLQAQTTRRVGLIDYAVVARGLQAIAARIAQLRGDGVTLAIADAVSNADLLRLGAALKGARLMTAGSGLAIGLAQNFGIQPSASASQLPPAHGFQAIVSGSCSAATNRQVAAFQSAGQPAMAIDPMRIAAGEDVAGAALAWAGPLLRHSPVLVYSSAEASEVKAVQGQLGVADAGALVEATLARIGCGLVALGVGQLVVAGGETSGACVQALGISRLRIGPQIDPGVPWCHALAHQDTGRTALHIALKSGNFGGDDFFTKAFTSVGTAA